MFSLTVLFPKQATIFIIEKVQCLFSLKLELKGTCLRVSGFKDLQSRKSTAFLKLPTRDEIKSQVRFKRDESENGEEEQTEKVEETQKWVEEETKEFDDNVRQNVRGIQETQLERWKDAIMKYIEDSKALRVKEEQVISNNH